MTAVWTSRHDGLVSDDVVASHVFDPMVVPDRSVVLTRCSSLESAVDAVLDAAARALSAEHAADDGVVYVPQAFHVSPSPPPMHVQRADDLTTYTHNLLPPKKLRQDIQ